MLNVGDKVKYSANSPFFYAKHEMVVLEVKTITKEDVSKGTKVSLGVGNMIKKKGSAQVAVVQGPKDQCTLPVRFFKKVK